MTSETETRAPTRRQIRLGGTIALAGLTVWILVGLPFIVFPRIDAVPAHADAVLVLGPPVPERVAVAERLLAAHRVDTALVSVPGEASEWDVQGLCARSDVICFKPDPSTTRGEAEVLRRYAAARHWSSVVVTTTTSHITRARSIVGRCFTGEVSMVADSEAPFRGWAYQYAYQTAATVKAWILQGC